MEISEIELQLEEVGLTKSEIKVYFALLELGPSTSGPIIRKSGTANSKVYIVLEKLIQKGLVTSFQERGLKQFKAAAPSQIMRYLKEKEESIRSHEMKVAHLIPSLEALYRAKEPESEAVVFRGHKGIKTAFNDLVDTLKPGDEVNIMGVHRFGEKFKPLAVYFQKIRSQKKIKANFLMNKDAKPIADLFAKYPPLEVRFMEEGIFTPAIFLIYKNNVIINLSDELVFFLIKSTGTAQAFNAYFKHFWKTAEKYV